MPVNSDDDAREEFLGKLRKSFGSEDAVRRGVDLAGRPVVRIPHLSPMATWATTGGVAWGHVCRWYGPEHSGKSLLNWGWLWCAQNYHLVLTETYERDIRWLESINKKFEAKAKSKELKKLLQQYPPQLYTMIYDTEDRVEMSFLQQLGLKPELIELSPHIIIEDICAGIRDGWNHFHIQIIDSASMAESMQEAAIKPGEYTQGSSPQAWTKWLKKALKGRDKQQNMLILIDQLRSQLGKTRNQGDQAAPPGIHALRHQASVAIEFQKAKRLYRDDKGNLTDDYDKADPEIRSLGTNGKEPHGVEMSCKVVKNSTGRPWRNARMRFSFPVADVRTGEMRFPIGFDEAWELLEIALYFDIIEKSVKGGYHYVLDEDFERTDETYQGESAMRGALEEDEQLRERILTRMQRDF